MHLPFLPLIDRHLALCALAVCMLPLCTLPAYGQQSATAAIGDSSPSGHDKRAAAKSFLTGARAIEQRDTRTAYNAFAEAASLDPTNSDYRNAAAVAKAHFASDLIQEAEKARILGKNDIARARLAEAFEVDPQNPMVAQHSNDLADLTGGPEPNGITTEIADAIRLEPTPGVHSFHLRADAQTLLRQVLAAYGIAPSFDASVTVPAVRFDADDVDYEHAAQLLRLETNTFFVPLDPHRVLVAKDTRENRANYERLLVESVYLPGLNTQEVTDIGNIARNVFDIQQATVQPGTGRLIVRGTASKLALLNHTLADLLQGHSQVLLDVKIYEIAHDRTVNVGAQLSQQVQAFNLNSQLNSLITSNQAAVDAIVSSGLANAGDTVAIAAILISQGLGSGSLLGQSFAIFGGGLTATGLTLGTQTVNLALNSSDSRAIDQLQLRLQDQESGDILSGLRYPIITSTYTNITSSSVAGLSAAGLSSQLAALGLSASASTQQQTIPQVQYQDLGLSMKATPHIHRDQSIALKLDIKLQALGATSINDIPVITNRQLTADLDLRDGENAVVSSNLTSSESRAITGIPGLSDIPGLQSGTNNNVEKSTDELVILITPHIVRLPHAGGASQVMLVPAHQ
jgi:type II secretory pathway component GspD/PulD (secretin)